MLLSDLDGSWIDLIVHGNYQVKIMEHVALYMFGQECVP